MTPQECVAHWLADSVEILIDPRGNGSQQFLDTAAAFKLGIFPFTNDPSNSNGNGVNGPCWERDADNHQGYATGPLAATVDGAPNAPGVQVASTRDVGRQQRDDRRPLLRRGRRLQPRGQDPAGRPPGGRRPEPHRPQHHAVRRGQHGGRRHDDAAAHRPEHAPRLVDVRQRPVRPVPLGPRDASGLHAAGRPADDDGAAERVAPEPRRRRSRRRRSTSRRRTACRSPAANPAPANDSIEIAGKVERCIADGKRRDVRVIDATGPGHRARLPLGGRPRRDSRCS